MKKIYNYLLIIEFFLAMFSAETVVDIESTKKKKKEKGLILNYSSY